MGALSSTLPPAQCPSDTVFGPPPQLSPFPHSTQPSCTPPPRLPSSPHALAKPLEMASEKQPPHASFISLHTTLYMVRAGMGSWGKAREVMTDGAGYTLGPCCVLHILVMLVAWNDPSRLVSTLTGPHPQLTVKGTLRGRRGEKWLYKFLTCVLQMNFFPFSP